MGKRKASISAPPAKSSKRVAAAQAAAAARIYNNEHYYSGPDWGATLRGSGRVLDVILLTDQIFSGSATGINSIPTIMKKLHDADDALPRARKNHWKAGHLLNAELGGLGHVSRNLTPLTAAANSQHKTYETRIKLALMYIGEFNKNHSATEGFVLGVEYSVTVSGNPLSVSSPYTWVAQNIWIHIDVVLMNDLQSDFIRVADDEIDDLPISSVMQAALRSVNEVAQPIFNILKP